MDQETKRNQENSKKSENSKNSKKPIRIATTTNSASQNSSETTRGNAPDNSSTIVQTDEAQQMIQIPSNSIQLQSGGVVQQLHTVEGIQQVQGVQGNNTFYLIMTS